MKIKPPALKKWDTIALVSPSGWLAKHVPHRVEQAIAYLESKWFRVVLTPNALINTDYTAGTASQRVDDLHWAFSNKEVKAIISMIGWFHANQLIEHLDYGLIRKNPKIFVGFSDASVLHFALYTQADLISFYWPSAITQFGESFGMDSYTYEYFEKAVMGKDPIGKIRPSEFWTDEMLDWFTKADLTRPREMRVNNGFKWLKEGSAEGVLVGWCITSILHLRGTKFWPDFNDALLFWEIPESSANIAQGEPVSRVDAHLQDLKLSGVFDKVWGMIVWRPKGYSDEEWEKFYQVILRNAAGFDFPILADIDIGHSDPMITLPIGARAKMHSSKNDFSIVESWVL